MKKTPTKKIITKKQSKQTILIVEDDKSLLKALSDKFNREGFNVLEAKNGEAGLKLALKNHPGLIMLDILMPKMNGITMLKKLRKDDWGKNVYVIMLTNREPANDLFEEANRTPYASSYILKSDYKLSEILKIVKNKLKKRIN